MSPRLFRVFPGHQGISTTTKPHQQGGRAPAGNHSVVHPLHLRAFRLAGLATGALTWWWVGMPQAAIYGNYWELVL